MGPGIVSFISASSYLAGPAFVGMRERLRRECDEIWVIDLGGEGRGPRRDENVFDIQLPVAIAGVGTAEGVPRPGVTFPKWYGSFSQVGARMFPSYLAYVLIICGLIALVAFVVTRLT